MISKKLKRKTRISPISKRRKEEIREYSRLRKEFLARYPVCYVWYQESGNKEFSYDEMCDLVASGDALNPCPATEVHHRAKRGKNYLNTDTWLAVSSQNHRRIEENKSWARANGYLDNI